MEYSPDFRFYFDEDLEDIEIEELIDDYKTRIRSLEDIYLAMNSETSKHELQDEVEDLNKMIMILEEELRSRDSNSYYEAMTGGLH